MGRKEAFAEAKARYYMDIKLIDAVTAGMTREVWRLYTEAFPEPERKSPKLMEDKYREGKVDILAVVDETGRFLGEMITVKRGELVLLDYFAISPDIRGGGIGSKSLEKLREYYDDSILILEIESTLEPADNSEQRQRRKRFYLSNGFRPLDWEVILFGIRMEILTSGKYVDYHSYHDIYETAFDRIISDDVKLFGEK